MRVFIVPAWAVGVALVAAPPVLYHVHYAIVWLWMLTGMPEIGANAIAFGIATMWLFGWFFWVMESGRVSLTTAMRLPRVEMREVAQ